MAKACSTEGCSIPSPRSDSQLRLHMHLTTISLPSRSFVDDTYYWVVNEVNCRGYSSLMTWNAVRPRGEIKDWANLVWFKGCVPKYAFNMWVSNLNRLPTRMRLASWDMNVPKE